MLLIAALVVIALLILAAIQLSPALLWRARPQGDDGDVDVAIILGFGYLQQPESPLEAGEANAFLFKWVREHYPQVTTMLVQEGVWAAACSPRCRTCRKDGIRLLRIHAHQEGMDVNTLDAAVCAMLKLRGLQAPSGRRKALLVAHHLQLWRSQRCFEKVKAKLYPECELVVPDIPNVPFPRHSAQWRTRSELNYRFAELLGRIRDLGIFFARVKTTCVAPLADASEADCPGAQRMDPPQCES